MGSIWGRFGIGLGSIWDQFGAALGSVWEQFGIDLGPFWGQFGVDLGSVCSEFDGDLRAFAEKFEKYKNPQKYKKKSKSSAREISPGIGSELRVCAAPLSQSLRPAYEVLQSIGPIWLKSIHRFCGDLWKTPKTIN